MAGRRAADGTDDFITRTLGSGAAKQASSINATEAGERQPLTGASTVKKLETTTTRVARVFTLLLGVAFGAGGLFGLITVVGSLQFFMYLMPALFWVPLWVFVFMILSSFATIPSAIWRVRPATALVGFVSVVVIAFGISGLVVDIAISDGRMLSPLRDAWNTAAHEHESAICDFQSFFECQGWLTQCNFTTFAPTPIPPHTDPSRSPDTRDPAPATDRPNTDKPKPSSPPSGSGSSSGGRDADIRDDLLGSSGSGSGSSTPAPHRPDTRKPDTPHPGPRDSTPAPSDTKHVDTAAPPTPTQHTETPGPPPPPEVFVCPHCPSSIDYSDMCADALRTRVHSKLAVTVPLFLAAAGVGVASLALILVSIFKVRKVHATPW